MISAKLGYNVTGTNTFTIQWSNTYNYSVKINIYPIYNITTGELWEDDIFFDDEIGTFTSKQAIGDEIRVTKIS